ncbi:ubiquitin carboxyl-terminal hydrolase 10 isoform X2 [Takifugu rubripes]|uniref:ubiquitin carboxyl-terminal hydrolase 10 isoform X2 n=1 Tax=Takifugu rubripes TaxID=31033 RepID=UPI0005D15662|nr:ubiquitin carboxyl-terminal hydrolase 10 isoform X2 [Takifugu rubripes]|eukprot:XP_011608582.1 PREDICTED: ubiquitin carboxyl-terminal hydrolase 10 isoform X2 [Takifugu rubripes]
MASSYSNQYFFGEFSADEINQFFVTPRGYVELPPFNDKVPCVTQSSGSYCTPAVPYIMESMGLQVCEDYQRIEFGVDEVMDSESVGGKDQLYKVSSTLNPQAPEFILGCQPVQKALQASAPAADVPDETHFDSLDGPDSEASALDNHQTCQDMDGLPGSLGQRERKKKKKRPPGYYNYLDPSGVLGNNSGGGVEGVPVTALVNGHALGGPHHPAEEVDGKPPSGAELSIQAPVTATSSDAAAVAKPATTPTANQRTCESPDAFSLDLSGSPSSSVGNNATSSSSSSCQSSGMTEEQRTAEQQADTLAPQSPEPSDGSQSPNSKSPLPALAGVASPPVAMSITTTELEGKGLADSGLANGLAEPDNLDSTDGHKEDCESGEQPQHSSSDSGGQAAVAEQAHSPATPAAPNATLPKSWASLFHNSKPVPGGPQAFVEVKNVEVVSPSLATPEQPEKVVELKNGPVHVSEDPMAPKLAELIENVKLIHKPVSLQPRGLVNKGNWCYINATLQALIACPPMYHLMKSIPMLSETQRPCTSTPMMDNFVRLVNEFNNMPVPSKAKQQAVGDKVMKDIRPGVPFEPTYIYKLLTLIKSSLSEKGRQEDAEEYLGFTLNGLHEEMLALKKLISPQEEKAPTPNGPESQSGVEEDAADKDEEGSEDEWEQVGPRNKTSITRQADFVRTPITDIFGGHIRSVVYQQNSKESATLQPFFTLQLDIQSEKIRTVQEALETMVARESVQGYTSKTKQEIEISRRVTLEELPPVLVLHLKRFVFEKTGGCQKLSKNIDYPVDLEISKDLLSSGVRSKVVKGQRTYRLFAVVYHHGNSATGGHYTTDVFHIGLNGWLRIDDQAVKVINQYHLLKQSAERTAYLLYYRRVDLL